MSPDNPLSLRLQALANIHAERRRQVAGEGWNIEHDDGHDQAELARAGAAFALVGAAATMTNPPHEIWRMGAAAWPWADKSPARRDPAHPPRRCLVIAAALLLAEIERLDRAALAAERNPR